MHFDPEESVFINLFDIQRSDPIEHFTRVCILRHLARTKKVQPTYGYAPVHDVVTAICQIGFSEQHVRQTMQFLYEKGCVEARLPHSSWSSAINHVRATTRGRYQAQTLVKNFNYVDAVIVDTPILDDAVRSKIRDTFPIRERLDRCAVFLDYLDECAKAVNDTTAQGWCTEITESVRSEIARIRPQT